MNGINPKYAAYLGLLILLEQAIGHGGAALLTNVVPTSWIDHITATCNFLAFTGTTIMTYQAGVSSNQSGPWINTSIAPVAKVAIFLAVTFALLGFAPSAYAQQNLLPKFHTDLKATQAKINTAINPAAPAAPTQTSAVASIDALMNKIDTIASKVVTDTVADIQAADADAGTIITPAVAAVPATATTSAVAGSPAVVKDAISHACYPAAVQFIQSLPISTNPLTGTLFGVQLFQRKRDFLNQLKAGLPDYLKIGCGALLGDEVKIFTSLMGLVGVTVATGGIGGLFPAAAALPALTL